jgi:colanic acid/amylovoran biosynthesis glycosyltransferase
MMRRVGEPLRGEYQRLFEEARWLVAVAPTIRDALIRLGAPAEKIIVQPSGAECERFSGARPANADAHFVSVGRFVPKKAPQRVVEAFALARQQRTSISLTMIGEGPLLAETRKFAGTLGVASAIRFLGGQPHECVADEMRQARAFLQHSVVAPDGDSEGTPVSVMEAGASGLPVIATRHAGIPNVVLHGQTDLLVDEHDVSSMADAIVRLTDDPELAGLLGRSARERVTREFSVETTAKTVFELIQRSIHPQQAA